MPADIILYAIIAAGLVYWLKSILGTRHGEERERPNPFDTPRAPTDPLVRKEKSDDTVPVQAAMLPIGETGDDKMPLLPRGVSIEPAAQQAIADIARQDKNFNISHFAQGAGDAFAFIVEAFAEGDRETLKELLSPSVYGAFDQALIMREKAGEQVSTEIHAVRKIDILEAAIRDKVIFLTVRFTADETCIIRDREGAILSGDPDHVTEMNDIWVFGRNFKSRDLRWLVYETRDGDVMEEHKTPLPDTESTRH